MDEEYSHEERQERKRKERARLNQRRMNGILLAVVFLIFGIAIFNMDDNQTVEDPKSNKEVSAEDKKERKKPEVTIDLEHATPKTIGGELKKYSKDITGAKVKDKTLIVQYKDSAFWSENTMVESYALDSICLLEDLYKNKNFDLFAFEWSTVMTDDNGNEELKPVLKSYYTRQTLDQMNLDNFSDIVLVDRERFFQKADGYWIHLGVFQGLKKSLGDKINSPINFKNADDSRYDMHLGATNDVVKKSESVEKEEPIVAEPVTEERNTDAQTEVVYDTDTILPSIYNVSQMNDQLAFKIDELNKMVRTSGDKVTAPISSQLFSLKEMIDPINRELTKLQNTNAPDDVTATTQQLAANQDEINRIYERLQLQFQSIDQQDYSDAAQLSREIKQNFNEMKRLTQTDISAYTTFIMKYADEEAS
ncbi:hypothetical protein [uncultured Exiguobacterium sp.]|uniref:hypothetical protein n=1 Tax=uncultured Exiguobacterium sp. TaxID=202669 RepID=UPI0037498DB3